MARTVRAAYSLKYGKSMSIILCILTITCSSVDLPGCHCSSGLSLCEYARKEIESLIPSRPRSEQAQAYFSFVIQVRVEPYRATASSSQMHLWRDLWVFERYEAIELEETALVRRPVWPCNNYFSIEHVSKASHAQGSLVNVHDIVANLVDAHKDTRGKACGDR